MHETTTIAIWKKTKYSLIEIKGEMDKKTGNIHSMNDVVAALIKNYQLGDKGEKDA